MLFTYLIDVEDVDRIVHTVVDADDVGDVVHRVG